RCCLTDLGSGALYSAAAGGGRLVNSLRRIPHIDFDFTQRHAQFLGSDLCEGGLDAGTEFDLARNHRYGAVLTDSDPGIELRGIRLAAAYCLCIEIARRGKEIEADDQGAGAFKKLSATQFDGLHVRPSLGS